MFSHVALNLCVQNIAFTSLWELKYMRTTENRRARMRCGRNTFRVYYPFDYRFEALFVLVLAPSLSPSQLWLCLSLWTSSSVGRSSSSFAHFECQTRRKFTQVIYICSLSVIFTRMKKKTRFEIYYIYMFLSFGVLLSFSCHCYCWWCANVRFISFHFFRFCYFVATSHLLLAVFFSSSFVRAFLLAC